MNTIGDGVSLKSMAHPDGLIEKMADAIRTGKLLMPKEHIDQLGISVAPDGSIICRYVNGEGQRVTLDLTAIIEERAEAAVQAHVQKLHGHSL